MRIVPWIKAEFNNKRPIRFGSSESGRCEVALVLTYQGELRHQKRQLEKGISWGGGAYVVGEDVCKICEGHDAANGDQMTGHPPFVGHAELTRNKVRLDGVLNDVVGRCMWLGFTHRRVE